MNSQFKRINLAATERGLSFLLIGGHAVNAHGYSRKTFDLDLLICRDDSEAWRVLMSLESLLALKLHAARHALPHRRHKDLIDIFALVEANGVDVTSDSFRQLCDEYGTAELYADIFKATRGT